VPWEYRESPLEAIADCRLQNFKIVGLELSDSSQKIADYAPPERVCLVVGHEVSGIPKEVIGECDDIVYIPMHGKKESLNVSVATGIALDHLRN